MSQNKFLLQSEANNEYYFESRRISYFGDIGLICPHCGNAFLITVNIKDEFELRSKLKEVNQTSHIGPSSRIAIRTSCPKCVKFNEFETFYSPNLLKAIAILNKKGYHVAHSFDGIYRDACCYTGCAITFCDGTVYDAVKFFPLPEPWQFNNELYPLGVTITVPEEVGEIIPGINRLYGDEMPKEYHVINSIEEWAESLPNEFKLEDMLSTNQD